MSLTNMATQSDLQTATESPRTGLIASPLHTLLVVALVAFNAYRGTLNAVQARAGLGPSRPHIYLRTILFECLFLGVVAIGVRLRGSSLHTIFGRRWDSLGQLFRDFGIGILLLLGSLLVVSLLSGHQSSAASNSTITFLIPRTLLEFFLWLVVSLVAGICEEAIYRGYFQVQFAALTHSVPAGILISAAAFAAVHAYQGLRRALVIGVMALLFGLFAQWRGTVRPGMIAHTLQDALAPLLLKLVRH